LLDLLFQLLRRLLQSGVLFFLFGQLLSIQVRLLLFVLSVQSIVLVLLQLSPSSLQSPLSFCLYLFDVLERLVERADLVVELAHDFLFVI